METAFPQTISMPHISEFFVQPEYNRLLPRTSGIGLHDYTGKRLDTHALLQYTRENSIITILVSNATPAADLPGSCSG
jgi:hypothetical protein